VCVDGPSRQNMFENLQCFGAPGESEQAVEVERGVVVDTGVDQRGRGAAPFHPMQSVTDEVLCMTASTRIGVDREALQVSVAAGLAADGEGFEAFGGPRQRAPDAVGWPW